MGCLTSKKVTPRMFYEAHPQFKKFQTSFAALKLSGGELTCLAEIFREFDLDSSGEISISEFFKSLELKGTSFSERCFALFDYDKSGELDFREFTISLWNYCTADSYALISFAFDLYDLVVRVASLQLKWQTYVRKCTELNWRRTDAPN